MGDVFRFHLSETQPHTTAVASGGLGAKDGGTPFGGRSQQGDEAVPGRAFPEGDGALWAKVCFYDGHRAGFQADGLSNLAIHRGDSFLQLVEKARCTRLHAPGLPKF